MLSLLEKVNGNKNYILEKVRKLTVTFVKLSSRFPSAETINNLLSSKLANLKQ